MSNVAQVLEELYCAADDACVQVKIVILHSKNVENGDDSELFNQLQIKLNF